MKRYSRCPNGDSASAESAVVGDTAAFSSAPAFVSGPAPGFALPCLEEVAAGFFC